MIVKQINNVVNEMYKNGLADELFVMEAVSKTLGGECTKSSVNEDKFDHIDFWWDSPKMGRIGIDVKGIKKNRRIDKEINDAIHWIEMQNVRGNKGWIYGKSKYIAFRTTSNIIFVSTEKLRVFAEEKIKGKEIVYDNPKDCYIPYQRKKFGRKDITFKVPTSDLIEISDFIVVI